MKHSLGDNWQEYFDIVMAFSKKPLFHSTESPFFSRYKKRMDSAEDMVIEEEKIFTEGNASTLTRYLQLTCNKDSIRIADITSHLSNAIASM